MGEGNTDRPLKSSFSRRRLEGFDYSDPDSLYFLTVCSDGQGEAFRDQHMARMVVSKLLDHRTVEGFLLYAYCLMPDHLHLLLQLEEFSGTVPGLMRLFKSATTKESWTMGHSGRLWQQSFCDHVARAHEDPGGIVDYILDNPVRKGLVTHPQRYPYLGMPDPLH